MTARHARTVALAAILITLAPGVWVHARQELTPAAVAETHARAGHGDADAQYELGIMYAEGRGVPQDYDKARALFGRLYEARADVLTPQDYDTARALFERVAQLEGDRGARALIKDHPGVVRLPVDDPGCIVDIDTRDDLRVYARA